RQQVVWKTTGLHFMTEKIDDVIGDRLRGVILLSEGTTLVTKLGLDYGDDLLRVAGDRGGTDTGIGLGDVEYLTIGGGAGGDQVMDAFEGGLASVDLDNDLVADHENFRDNAAG